MRFVGPCPAAISIILKDVLSHLPRNAEIVYELDGTQIRLLRMDAECRDRFRQMREFERHATVVAETLASVDVSAADIRARLWSLEWDLAEEERSVVVQTVMETMPSLPSYPVPLPVVMPIQTQSVAPAPSPRPAAPAPSQREPAPATPQTGNGPVAQDPYPGFFEPPQLAYISPNAPNPATRCAGKAFIVDVLRGVGHPRPDFGLPQQDVANWLRKCRKTLLSEALDRCLTNVVSPFAEGQIDWPWIAKQATSEWNAHQHRCHQRALEVATGLPYEQIEAKARDRSLPFDEVYREVVCSRPKLAPVIQSGNYEVSFINRRSSS